ncbi:MAG TPA: fibronectin type III domain-containing protein [Kiritimatiellia bacterium]|nr:fibronectin type III domain-containing protein [Kiritimatiellia bacterium]
MINTVFKFTGLVLAFAGISTDVMAQAIDHAGRYSQSEGNWVANTHRGDFHFGDWSFDGSASSFAGRFIGDSTSGAGNINVDGKSFALFGHSGTFAGVARRFAKPEWTTGDTLTFQIAVNFRNGDKGFNLRNSSGQNVWLFLVGRRNNAGGYFVNDSTTSLGDYHANTIFTFTFTQRARDMVWTIVRSGGINATYSGTNSIPSGVIRDVRFFCANTDNSEAVNNLYFNNFSFTPAVRGNAPLTLGERRFPGFEPTYMLRFEDPVANSVTFRSSHDGWTTSYPLAKVNGIWELDIRDTGLTPGWHTFKFRPDSQYESGDNRRIYIRQDGKITKPPAVYVTWQRDPTTTMTIHWHVYNATNSHVRYRLPGNEAWSSQTIDSSVFFGHTERLVQTAELTGLLPDTVYEFEVDGYDETFSFKTMPVNLDQPVKGMFTGDILFGWDSDTMAVTAAAFDPDFLMVGGDLAYSDSRAEQFWLEYMYFENWYSRFRTADGRMIPLIVAIGNHEVRKAYVTGYPYIEDTDSWRDREAVYFFRAYAFPGQPGYNVLDFGDYLSLIALDSDHLNPMLGVQTDWLTARLNERRHVRHVFPVYHVPAYPSHRDINDQRNVSIRQNWVPLFENAGLHMVFEHHDHTFKRTTPILAHAMHPDGIVFLGDGCWGVAKRSVKDTYDPSNWYLQKAESRHHVYLVTMTDTGRYVKVIDADGIIFDEMSQIGDGIPGVPFGLSIEHVTSISAGMSWSPSPRAVQYMVERDGAEIGIVTEAQFTDSNRIANTTADYRIYAINRSGMSEGSTILSIATTATPPLPGLPSGLSGSALGPHAIHVMWNPGANAYGYTIFRDGITVASNVVQTSFSESGLSANSTYSYHVRSDNVSGSSSLAGPIDVMTGSPIAPFTLNGQPESEGYLLSSPGMTLYAAMRGSELYLATWTPVGYPNDHFIFLSDHVLPSPTTFAPWNKKGFTAHPSGAPYIAAESDSDYIEWFNAPPGSLVYRSPVMDAKIEGVIDVVQTFGRLPEFIYLSSAAYGTGDLHPLHAQAPPGNGDEHIQAEEFLVIPIDAIQDSWGIGVYDRLDPARSFIAEADEHVVPGSGFVIRWRSVPGRGYHIWRLEDFDGDAWVRVTSSPLIAPSGVDEMSYTDLSSESLVRAFYKVEVAP